MIKILKWLGSKPSNCGILMNAVVYHTCVLIEPETLILVNPASASLCEACRLLSKSSIFFFRILQVDDD
jgi:hypothetical protein